jgi:hypothetical protein
MDCITQNSMIQKENFTRNRNHNDFAIVQPKRRLSKRLLFDAGGAGLRD